MNDLEVARELRQRQREAPLRIIAVTGWGQEKDRGLTRDAGFDFHLTKPVNVDRLEATVRQLTTHCADAGATSS